MAVLSDEIVVSNMQTVRRTSPVFDHGFRWASYGSALIVLAVLAGILGTMVYGGWPAFREFGFGFITSSVWNVGQDQYGAWIGIAIFLTQLCPPWLRRPVSTTIELLAAVPSIIYGMWGLFVFAPLFANYVQIPLTNIVEGMPIIGTVLYARVPSGVGMMTAGIILAIMIIPFIASITRDILDQIPTVLRESAYGIGCTTWEVVRNVLLPQAGVSIIGAIMLGLGRALGETMAVTFVIGNANRLSLSLFDPSSTIASRIANEFNEASGMQMSALLALGCILFVVTFIVLALARLLISRVKTH
jgi:phosphate transport system permease protein